MPTSSSQNHTLTLTLVSLLPSYTVSTLPARLIQLSESLLAQSRQRAPHLKPEEEIARAHACCEIACLRLRAKLRLPAPKTGGAPCKPATYRKLVAFLGGVLDETPTTTTSKSTDGTPQKPTPGTAGKKRTADGSIKTGVEGIDSERRGKGKASGTNGATRTPSKSKTKSTTSTSSSRSTTRKEGTFRGKVNGLAHRDAAAAAEEEEAPRYVMSLIRRLCRTFVTPLLAPHVYTGVCVVLKLDGLWPPPLREDPAHDVAGEKEKEEKHLEEKITGLLVALYLMALTRMQKASKMTTAVYKATCARAVAVLGYHPGVKGVEGWIRRINQQGYARGQEWFGSVPERVFEFDPNAGGDIVEAEDGEEDEGEDDEGDGQEGRPDGDHGEEEDDDDDLIISGRRRPRNSGQPGIEDDEEVEEDPDGVLLPGLHTMMHLGLDFLGEERTREFEQWKKQFLQRLDRLDRADKSHAAGRAAEPEAVTVAAA
ncbi:hypothetical protein G647_07242 [Cladophialophora carrionii CBS 160.54]|uniref:ORC6 first cyclin-like domain-containing protein n=1 Tax=Cladophialophora carrionii CBS 160.54 TaxID=1279043 RepID=V9D1W4_9EURO|nr:uncharacterized protein G647_07242 [Cladophialophora carrionii CBS 160.54]ETI20899.1 hypothetical protein G647_07242 [Cladophialophora carrionii CBS 160.54]